ncbi:MAG: rod shape-determining protein MreC [Betaproteobacteria bacterium]|nr:rod shape-determining protein MreC [Betaproteobacteria bacterium]
MEHSPPPFFKRGPAPLVRLAFFASLSIALLVLDARFKYGESLRSIIAVAVYPLQQIATAPGQVAGRIAGFFASQSSQQQENAELRAKLVASAMNAQRFEATAAELAQLRRLVGAQERLEFRSTAVEVLYTGRDPFARKLLVDKGATHGIRSGQAVIDETGVVGQVTRVHPMVSEITLLIDKDQAIPVQVVRNGLRAVAFGSGPAGTLELRFMAANAEIQNGDKLVTSGIDGTYPPGLPVATVIRIERDAVAAFARIVCQPSAGVERNRYLLALSTEAKLPPYPPDAVPPERKGRSKGKRRKDAVNAE